MNELYELCTTLLYGPKTWFDACREAASGGPAEVAELFARLEPDHQVARALMTRQHWPGATRLRPSAPDRPAGPAISAARAAAEVVAMLAGGNHLDERVRTASDHWRRAHVLPAVALSGADVDAGRSDAPLGTVARRLAVLADGAGPDDAPAAGLIVLLARALRGAFPRTIRDVELPVLFDRRSAGGHGLLRVSCLNAGPPGLYPDPRSMLFLVADPRFAQALDAAWRTAPQRLRRRCVVWQLTTDGQPCDEIQGGSLGGAFGVGLSELAKTVRRLGRLRPRRLDRRCAVTAGLAPDGTLLEVGGQPNKLEEAVRQRWRVVLSKPRPGDESGLGRPSAALLRDASVRYAADLPAAVRQTRTRLNPAFVAMVVAVILAASGIAGASLYAVRAANDARQLTIGNRLLADADAVKLSDPAGALLLGSLAVQLNAPGARAALVRNLMTGHYAGALPASEEAVRLCGGPQAWTPDGELVAAAGATSVTVWDIGLRRIVRTHPTGRYVSGCAFAPDGATLAAAVEGDLVLFPQQDLPANDAAFVNAGIGVDQVWFAPNGLLATASSDKPVQLWAIERSGSLSTRLLGAASAATEDAGVAFSPDSRTLAAATPSATTLVDVSRPEATQVLASIPGNAASVAFSPDGATLAIGRNGSTDLWDVRDLARPSQRESLRPPHRLGLPVSSLAFSPDGSRVVTSGGGLGEVWEVGDGQPPVFAGEVTTGPHQVTDVAVAPIGDLAVVHAAAGELTLWQTADRTTPPARATLPLGGAMVEAVSFPATATLVVTAHGGAATSWDATDPADPRLLHASGPGDGKGVGLGGIGGPRARFSADGRRFAHPGLDGAVDIWEIAGHRLNRVGTIPATSERSLVPAALSADGTMLAMATARDNLDEPADPVALWDVRGEPRVVGHLADDPEAELAAAAFSADGRVLVTHTSHNTTTWWNVADPANPRRLTQHTVQRDTDAGAVAFSTDGRLMAITDAGSPGALWDLTNPAAPQLLSTRAGLGGGFAGDAAFAGPALVVGSLGVISIWDISDPRDPRMAGQFESRGAGPFSGPLAVSSSGLLATAQLDGVPKAYYTGESVVRLWNLTPILDVLRDPVAVACRIAGGRMSDELWRRFAPELPPRPVCP